MNSDGIPRDEISAQDIFNLGTQLINKYDLHGWQIMEMSIFDALAYFRSAMMLTSYDDKAIVYNPLYVRYYSRGGMENALRHEIAHALLGPEVASEEFHLENGHGPKWKRKALELGAAPYASAMADKSAQELIDMERYVNVF